MNLPKRLFGSNVETMKLPRKCTGIGKRPEKHPRGNPRHRSRLAQGIILATCADREFVQEIIRTESGGQETAEGANGAIRGDRESSQEAVETNTGGRKAAPTIIRLMVGPWKCLGNNLRWA